MPLRSQFASREEYNNYFRKYRKENLIKMRKYQREYNRKWRVENGYHNEKKWKDRNPLKVRVENLTRYAIKIGLLKRLPCEKCGNERSQAHHDDYTKPLAIIWLCRPHHLALHNKARE